MVLPKQWFNYNVINSPIAKDWSQPNQIQNSRDMKPWQNTDSCSGSTQIYKETKKKENQESTTKNQQLIEIDMLRERTSCNIRCMASDHAMLYLHITGDQSTYSPI